MGYLDQLIQFNAYQDALAGRIKGAYAAYYAPYEVQTPQTPVPNPYTLATTGYRANSLIYAAVNYRARAVAEAPIVVQALNDQSDEEEIEDHLLKQLLSNPNVAMTEEQFWQVVEINLCVAGFSAWEMELSNGGVPLALWPMRSDWCQFYRGVGQPIRAVRYQPYGLPPVDVPIEKILLFQYYDPIYPLLKGLSPLAVALNIVEVDNFATAFLNDFMKHGAMPSGLLVTDQVLNKPDADDLRVRWQEQHGGAQNWSKPAVLGKGVTYQNTGAQFSPGFDFSKLDGRDESRMCMAIGVEPILIGAQVGLQASTYSNYEEARKAFYQARVNPEWRYLASELREQLLPKFEVQSSNFTIVFDLSTIKALQEDRTEVWQRATQAWTANLLTQDEARGELGQDPIESIPPEKRVFYKDTLSFAAPSFDGQGETESALGAGTTPEPSPTANAAQEENAINQSKDEAAKELERKQFKSYLRHRKNGDGFSFQHLDESEQRALMEAQSSETLAPFRRGDETAAYRTAYP